VSKIISAYFTEAGAGKTGLSPTVDVYDVSDNSKDVTAGAMTEIASGHYKYTFSGHDATKDYVAVCDGTATLPNYERYTYAEISANTGLQTVVALFTVDGVGETGLSPTVSIWKVSDNTQVVTDADMTEIAGGYYKYTFSAYVENTDYVFTADGGSGLESYERYAFGSSAADVVYNIIEKEIEVVLEDDNEITVEVEVNQS